MPTPTPALLRTLPFASSVRLIRDRSRHPWPRPQARFYGRAKASVLPRQNSGTFSEAIGEFAGAIIPPRPNGNNLPRPKPVPTPTPALLRTLPFASSVRLIRDRSRHPWPRPQARFYGRAKASVLPRQNSGTFSEAIGEFAGAIIPPRPNGNNLPRPKPVPTPTPALLRTLPFASSVRLIRDRSRHPWSRPQARFPDML